MNYIVVIAVLLSIGGAYVGGRWDGIRLEQGTERRAEDRARDVHDQTMGVVADLLSKQQVKTTVINQKVQHDVVEKPVYRDAACQHDPATFELLNAALQNRAPKSEPTGDSSVPGSHPTVGPIVRGDDAQVDRSGGDIF